MNAASSRVLLVTDSTHGIPVRVARSDVRAIASGTGELNRLELHHLPRSAEVKKDLLVSSGLGGTFPEGYPVGHVSRFDTIEGKPFAEVEAQLLASIDRLLLCVIVMAGTNAYRK